MSNTKTQHPIAPPEPEPLDRVLRYHTTATSEANTKLAQRVTGKRTLSDYLREKVDLAVERDLKEWREREASNGNVRQAS